MKVKLIGRKNAAALVEYTDNGQTKRVTVPFSVIKGDEVDRRQLSYGIPYGAPWAELIKLSATPQLIEEELHKRGIWTAQDALDKPQDVIVAVHAAYGLDVAAVTRAAQALARGE